MKYKIIEISLIITQSYVRVLRAFYVFKGPVIFRQKNASWLTARAFVYIHEKVRTFFQNIDLIKNKCSTHIFGDIIRYKRIYTRDSGSSALFYITKNEKNTI